MGKRIFPFILTNIMVVATLSIVINLLGIRPYLTKSGIDLRALAAFAMVYGFGGAFVSLALSRQMAKWMQGVTVINPNSPGEFHWLVQTVHDLSRRQSCQPCLKLECMIVPMLMHSRLARQKPVHS